MNWEVIFLDGKEGRPYRECKICRALKDRGLIEEVEPVAVFIPLGKDKEILGQLASSFYDVESRLKEFYKGLELSNVSRKIKVIHYYENPLIADFTEEIKLNIESYETCIFHCEKDNSIWIDNGEWNLLLLQEFYSRLGRKLGNWLKKRQKFNFSFYVFPSLVLSPKALPGIVSYLLSEKPIDFSYSKFLGNTLFSMMRFNNVNFSGAEFENVSFLNAVFETVKFPKAKFKYANFSDIKLEKGDFSEAVFENVYFCQADFNDVIFRRAKFKAADFFLSRFRKADFSKAEFETVDFTGVIFKTANFREIQVNKKFIFHSQGMSFFLDLSGIKFCKNCEFVVKGLHSTYLLINDLKDTSEKFFVYDLLILPFEKFASRFRHSKKLKINKEKGRKKKRIINQEKIKISIENAKKSSELLKRFKNRANLEIVGSNLSQAKFVNCDFSGAERIRIENSDLTDVRFLATDWGDITEKRICPELFEKEPKKARDVYRQLKLTLDNHKDFVSANGFYALEMKAQERILEQSMGIYREGEGILSKLKSFLKFPGLIWNCIKLSESSCELLVLKIHRISSNFGQNWVRPLLWLYFLSLIFSLFFHFDEWSNLFKVNYLNFGDSSLKVMDFVIGLKVFCCKLLTAFSIPLQMVAEITKVVKGEFNDSNPIVVASRLLYTVVAGFLIYQFGGAVRRRVKR